MRATNLRKSNELISETMGRKFSNGDSFEFMAMCGMNLLNIFWGVIKMLTS